MTDIQQIHWPVAFEDDDISRLVKSFFNGRNQRTLDAYRHDLDDFRKFTSSVSVTHAATVLLADGHGKANMLALDYKNHLIDRGFQSSTINRRLAALRSLVKLARTAGLVSWTLEIRNENNIPYRDTKGPGSSAFSKMLSLLIDNGSSKQLRDRAIMRLLHDLALRASEVVNIDISDLDVEARTVAIMGKGQNQKIILSLPDETIRAIKAWINVRGIEAGPLFLNFDRAGKGNRLTRIGLYQIVRKLGQRIGIKTRPHGIRHLSITEACKVAQAHGYDLEEVLDHSRHASVATLMIYRDRERNVQGKIAGLVASTTDNQKE